MLDRLADLVLRLVALSIFSWFGIVFLFWGTFLVVYTISMISTLN